jgi:hypothetical protein
MGSAEILSNAGEGLYSVKIKKEVDRMTSMVTLIDSKIIEITSSLETKEAEKTAKELEIEIIQAEISEQIDILADKPSDAEIELAEEEVKRLTNLYHLDPPEASMVEIQDATAILNDLKYKKALAEIAEEVINLLLPEGIRLNVELSNILNDIAMLNLQQASLAKKKESLENEIELAGNDIRDAWSADYSLELADVVPTCEVNGEPTNIILFPAGISEAIPTIPNQTGIITPIIAQSAAQTALNFAITPGWQKWKPTFRVGEIIAIDYDNETCSVNLDDDKSHFQDLPINQSDPLSDVPIKYMDCNSSVFEVGDRVLVKFTDQLWSKPSVIGFESYPKRCTWVEPWNGPELTSKWPWAHLYQATNDNPAHSPLADLSTAVITQCPPETTPKTQECSYISIHLGETPSGEGWIDETHVWRLDKRTIEGGVFEHAYRMRLNIEADPIPINGYYGYRAHQYALQLSGKNQFDENVYFHVYFVNNTNYLDWIPFICAYGPGFPDFYETDWSYYNGDWIKTIESNKTDWFDFPVQDVNIDLVQIYVWVGVNIVPPVPAYLNAVNFKINHIEIGPEGE